jgi:hypothetical protein
MGLDMGLDTGFVFLYGGPELWKLLDTVFTLELFVLLFFVLGTLDTLPNFLRKSSTRLNIKFSSYSFKLNHIYKPS